MHGVTYKQAEIRYALSFLVISSVTTCCFTVVFLLLVTVVARNINTWKFILISAAVPALKHECQHDLN